jgi:quercetin dioxygenase-like cupin family protein
MSERDYRSMIGGYLRPGDEIHREVLFDKLYSLIPRDPELKVLVFHAEIVPGGITNWHCHNGATFFVALQGRFEAQFEEGVLVRAQAGDVYSEPIGKFHRGHNPDASVPFVCIGFCLTSPDKEHVTSLDQPPAWAVVTG